MELHLKINDVVDMDDEKRHFIGFETNKEYFDIAQGRIDQVLRNPTLF